MSVQGLNAMDQKVSAYPNAMCPTITNHQTTSSMSFNVENVFHYLRLIMFGIYNNLLQTH
jgi:hypothetical protein